MPYPNVEPIRTMLSELGFTRAIDYPETYVRMFGLQPIYLYLWEETRCWDGEDTTHLQYRMNEPGSGKEAYNGWSYLPLVNEDGSYFSLNQVNVPTREGIRLSLDNLMSKLKSTADVEMRAAYEKYTALASMAW